MARRRVGVIATGKEGSPRTGAMTAGSVIIASAKPPVRQRPIAPTSLSAAFVVSMPGESAQPFDDRTRSISRPNRELPPNAKDSGSAFELVGRRKWPTRFSEKARQVYGHSCPCYAIRKPHHEGMKARDFVDHYHCRPFTPSKYGSGPGIIGKAEAVVAI